LWRGLDSLELCPIRLPLSMRPSNRQGAAQHYVATNRLVPLSLFDPGAAGYASKPASAQGLVLGSSREGVLEIETEMAGLSIA